MKKTTYTAFLLLVTLIFTLIVFMSSCKTTRVNKQGESVLTANQRHFNRVNPHGKWVGNAYLRPIKIEKP